MKLNPLKLVKPEKVRPLIRLDDKVWSSPGVRNAKPKWCKNNCPLASVSGGFVRDYLPTEPKVLVLFPTPNKFDVLNRDAWGSDFKKWFLWKIVEDAGLERHDVAIAHVLRCYCGGKYPSGSYVTSAESACRHYDYEHNWNGGSGIGGIADVFDPDLFYLTLDPGSIMGTQAFYRLFRTDFNRCAAFINRNYRPCLLCGSDVAKLITPFHLAGGIKAWRGHWWEGDWPFKRGNGTSTGKGFRT